MTGLHHLSFCPPPAPFAFANIAHRHAAIRHVVIGLVAAVLGVPADMLEFGARGTGRVTHARRIAIYLAHVAGCVPMDEAAALFGRSRASAGLACRVVEDAREHDPALDRTLDLLTAAVGVSLARLQGKG